MRIVRKGETIKKNNPVDVLKDLIKKQEAGEININSVVVIITENMKENPKLLNYTYFCSQNISSARVIYDMEVIKSVIIG